MIKIYLKPENLFYYLPDITKEIAVKVILQVVLLAFKNSSKKQDSYRYSVGNALSKSSLLRVNWLQRHFANKSSSE